MQEQILDALRSGDARAAVDMATAFAGEAPGNAQAQRLLALALRSAGDIQGAREAIEQAITLAPDDARLHLEHAGILLGARNVEAAGQALDASIGLDPNAFPAYILQAQLAMGRNDLDEAERLSRLAARVAPEDPLLLGLQGTLALRRGDADAALKLLAAAATQAPEEPLVLHALAFAYAAKGHLAFAEQSFRKLMQLAPQANAVRLMVSQLQLAQGRADEAAAELTPLLEDPATASPWLRRLAGELQLAAGRPDLALAQLREALAALPGEPRTMAAICEAWRRLEDPEDARRTLDAALATAPDNSGLWRARLAFEPAQGPGAAELIARWRERAPDSPDVIEAEMVLHASEGRAGEAEDAARRLLERVPGHPRAEMRVIDALMLRDPAEAARRLEALAGRFQDPADSGVLDAWLGLAQHRAGNRELALRHWSQLHAARAARRLPLPAASAAPAEWPAPAAAVPGAMPAAFLVGLPGSQVERAAQLLAPTVPTFRNDRFGRQPPGDLFQDMTAPARIAAGEHSAAEVIDGWRAALPARGISGAIIDQLPWWDNAYAAAMRAALPGALLLVPLRDPRDMLLDWLAFGTPTPFALESPQAAADYLAGVLEQVATLHELDLVPHHLLRFDATSEDPVAMAAQLGGALGIELPEPPADYFGPARLAAGTWREYAGLLAGPFATLAPVARRLGYPDA